MYTLMVLGFLFDIMIMELKERMNFHLGRLYLYLLINHQNIRVFMV